MFKLCAGPKQTKFHSKSHKSHRVEAQCPQTEAALAYDAVHLFTRALHDLEVSRAVSIEPLFCEGDLTWSHGSSLINYMKWVGN